MTDHHRPLFYALAVPAVIALGLSKGGFAGVGQMATPLLALVMPPLEAAAIFLPIMIVQDVNAVWVYRADWDRRILAIMIPGALIGIAGGGVLAAYISDAAVRVFIGVTTIVFVDLLASGDDARAARRPPPAACRPASSGARCRASPRPSARPAGRPTRCTCCRRSCRRCSSSAPRRCSSPRSTR